MIEWTKMDNLECGSSHLTEIELMDLAGREAMKALINKTDHAADGSVSLVIVGIANQSYEMAVAMIHARRAFLTMEMNRRSWQQRRNQRRTGFGYWDRVEKRAFRDRRKRDRRLESE